LKISRKKVVAGVAAAALVVATAALYYGARAAAIGAAYTAKIVCSGIFVSQRDLQSLLAVDVAADQLFYLRYANVEVDRAAREVEATLFGLGRRKAAYRDGQGCAIVQGGARQSASPVSPRPRAQHAADELDRVQTLPPGSDRARLDAALQWAFSEPDPALPRRTRAVVVLYKGRLVAERYADGFSKDTPLAGWSMTKSAMNALVGVLVQEGKVALGDPIAIPEWRESGDPRGDITLGQLLRMSSGLQFREDYRNPLADVSQMLFSAPGAGAYAAARPLEAPPGTRWSYSSGTTNIIAYAMRRIVGEPGYLEFPRRALFDRLGMTSAVMETDASGTFVGSSFMYATARDWARLGLLFLRDGYLRDAEGSDAGSDAGPGVRILPPGWVAYTRTPAPAATEGQYGAHFWLRISRGYRCAADSRAFPADTFHAVGYEGQFITIVPSRDLVLVRLGLTRYPCAWDQQKFTDLVLAALPDGKAH
jgi:CubicO group peptidase (beta-lactamase class C family)